MTAANRLDRRLGLRRPPVAVAFLDEPPEGLEAWAGPAPAGCSFWRAAMDGRAFYTVPADHYNCAVGAYTHGISLPEDRSAVLEDTIGFMVGKGYIQIAEVPSIPVLPKAPAIVAYAPLHLATFSPAVVLLAARP